MAIAGRMDEISNHAIGLLNEAKLQSDTSAKVDKLKQLKELILYKEPWLLPEFIPHLMELQSEPGSPVRKYLAEVIEEIGLKYTDQLPLMVPVLLVLLNDSVPAVARRAITSGANLFRNTLEQVALMGIYSGQVEKHIEDAWSWMTKFKDAVYPVAYQHANDGVRIHAVKFIETTIMLFTPDPSGSPHPPPPSQQNDGTPKGFNIEWIASKHPLLDAVAMGQEASKNLGLLLNQLRPPDISSLPCPVAIVLVNSLTAIAKKRPSMFGRILPALLSLGPTCEAIKGQVASLIHALKNSLLSLLKCTHPGAAPWRERLVEMLRKMNAGDAAEMTISQMFRNADKNSGHMNRNLKDEKVLDGTKKRAISQENGTGAWDDSSGKKFRATLTGPVLMTSSHQQVSSEMEDISSSTVDTGNGSAPDNGLSPFQHLIGMIGALVAQGDRATASIDLLIATLPPDTLADVVILNMQNLPMTEPSPSEDQSFMDGLPSLSPGRSQQVSSISLMATLSVQPNSVADAATASDTRRDPRRDPRRMDPRFSVGLASPKQEDAILAVNSAAAELDLRVGTESVVHPIAVKMEISSPTNSSRDPRASLQARSIPILGDTMPVHVKSEPMEEVSMSTSTPVLPPAISPGEMTPQAEVLSPVSPVKTELEVEPPIIAITQPFLKEAPNLSAPNIVGLPSGGGSMMIPVLPLNDEQQSALIKAALLRVLEGYKAITSAGGGELRIALLARLTAHSFAGAESLDIIQKHILGDYGNHMGHELALHVLYELYVEQIEDPGSETSFEVYNNFLLSLAEGLRDTLPPTDRALSKLLAEVPILPMEALKLLESLCNPISDAKDLSSERITQGLLALWNLILHRPPVRETCLKMTLQCAVHELEDVRAKAIRLVANKLYPLPCISKSIEDFACNMLLAAMSTAASADRATDSMDVISTSQTDSIDKAVQGDTELQGKHKPGATSLLSEASVDDDAQKGRNRNTSVSEAQRCMSLYFALCTKKHALLQQLFRAYGSAPKPVKLAMRKDFPLLIRTVGSSSPELLDIISDPPGGSEQLVLLALERLTDASTPSPELISTVKKLYETKLKDAMFLIPVLSSLSKDEVLPIFPRLVDLPPETFQVALARILQGSAHTGPALTPAEVLIALHGIDHQRDAVPLKKVTDACSACLQQRTVFTQQVLAKVLNQLVEQTPLPLLFMRTVIQAVGAFPSLVNFVMDILSRLVNKQIWKFPQLWVGFLKCAHQTVPQSFHVLLQLPTAQLENALSKFPGLKSQLSAHASQPTVRTTVPRSSLILLGLAQDEVSTDSVLPNTQPIQDSVSSGRAQSDAQPSESANVSS